MPFIGGIFNGGFPCAKLQVLQYLLFGGKYPDAESQVSSNFALYIALFWDLFSIIAPKRIFLKFFFNYLSNLSI